MNKFDHGFNIHPNGASQRQDLIEQPVIAVVDATELKAAQNDPRVGSFLKEADAYLAELEQQGRNR